MLTRNYSTSVYFDHDACRMYVMDDMGSLFPLDDGSFGPLMQMIFSLFEVVA